MPPCRPLAPLARVFMLCLAVSFAFSTATWSEETSSLHGQTSSQTAPDQAPPSHAQESSPQDDKNNDKTKDATPASTTPVISEKIPGVALYNLLQKKSVMFPDIAASDKRLTSAQKFQLFVDNSGSVHSVSWAVLGAAFGQADNSPTGFEQGWDAYAKRFGASMARSASSEFFGTFLISSALHLDPRFYAEANPTFGHAAKYSVQRVFIMRNDDGRDVIAWSRLAGPLMGEALANAYWPQRNRTVGDTLFRFGVDLATRAGGNMLREYWPVVYRKMGRATTTEPRGAQK